MSGSGRIRTCSSCAWDQTRAVHREDVFTSEAGRQDDLLVLPGGLARQACLTVQQRDAGGPLPLGGRGQAVLPGVIVGEGLLDAAAGEGSYALVDRQGLPQAGGALAGVAVLEVAAADAFQGACFLPGSAKLSCDGKGLGVVVAGLVAVGGPGR